MPHPSLRRSPAPRRFDHGEPIRAIDTRPLLVELPQPEAGLHANGYPPIVYRVEITASDQLRLNGEFVSVEQLVKLLLQASRLEPRPVLAFEPDGAASYNLAAHTLAIIHRAGLSDERFCINGMEKHGEFNKSRGHPLPLLTSLVPQEEIVPPRNPPMPEPPDVDTCAPELFGTTGR